jgi:hypothetical protein
MHPLLLTAPSWRKQRLFAVSLRLRLRSCAFVVPLVPESGIHAFRLAFLAFGACRCTVRRAYGAYKCYANALMHNIPAVEIRRSPNCLEESKCLASRSL